MKQLPKQTNLVPGLPVQDLYTVIADDVNAKLHVQKNTQSLAGDWLKFGIDRSFTKKIVMCKPFGMNGYTSMDVVEDVFKTKVMQGRPIRLITQNMLKLYFTCPI